MNYKIDNCAALHLWDYFYLSHSPREGEERPWRRIECATHRIVHSEQYLRDTFPAAVRLEHAKRVRRAVRETLRMLDQLESDVDAWISEALAHFHVLAEETIEASKEEASRNPIH